MDMVRVYKWIWQNLRSTEKMSMAGRKNVMKRKSNYKPMLLYALGLSSSQSRLPSSR